MFATMLGGWPAAVRDMLVRMHVTDEWMISGALERSALPDLRDELQAGTIHIDRPDAVVTAIRDVRDSVRRLDEAAPWTP